MKTLAVLALTLGTLRAQDFKPELYRLAQRAQAQLAATDAAIARALREGPARPPATPLDAKPRELDAKDREALRKALDRLAACSTGKLVFDPASRFYIPELRPGCGR